MRRKWKTFYFFGIFKFFSPLLRTKSKRTNTHNTVSDGWLLIVNFCGPYATKVLDWMLSRENSSLIFQKISSLFALVENFLTLLLSFSRCSVKGMLRLIESSLTYICCPELFFDAVACRRDFSVVWEFLEDVAVIFGHARMLDLIFEMSTRATWVRL